ncbi:MAG: mucoidy inhibitor MuiA family protein, partial [Promethearchaeota archaeon]
QKTILAHNRFSEEFPKWFSIGKVDIASVKEMNSLFKEQIKEISKDIRNYFEELSEIKRDLIKLNNQIKQLGYDNQNQSESYYKVSVVLDAEKEADITIELFIMVYDAYWTPFYDICINGEEVEVNLMANVYNQTEIDWNNINLNISTATTEPVILEKPKPYHIDHQGYPINRINTQTTSGLRGGGIENGKLDIDARNNVADEEIIPMYGEIAPGVTELGSVDSSVTSNFGVQTYNLKSKFTIVSDKNPKPVHLVIDKLPSIVQYFWTPTSPDRVLCNNKIRNKDRLILPGPAKVYVNDEYIGETQLDLIAPNQEFKLGERITYDITVKKLMKAKQKQKEGTFKGKRAVSYKFAIEIENLNGVKEPLILYDRIPHSISEKIKVKLGNFSEKYSRNVMNVLKFVLNMSDIKGKKVITYDYDVIYDKEVMIYPALP